MKIIIAFLKRDFLNAASYKFNYIFTFLGILFSVATFYFLSRLFIKNPVSGLESYGGNYFPFVLVGIAFSDYLMTALYAFSSTIREEQMTGTMESLLLTKTGLPMLLLSSSVYPFIFTTVRVFCYLGLGVILGVSFNGANIVGGLIIILLTVLSFASLGIISASFVMVFKKGDPVSWVYSGVSGLLGGVLYPVTVLPGFLQKLSSFFPLTYALRGMRRCLLDGAGFKEVALDIGALALFAIILVPLSVLVFNRALKKAKADGTLAHY